MLPLLAVACAAADKLLMLYPDKYNQFVIKIDGAPGFAGVSLAQGGKR